MKALFERIKKAWNRPSVGSLPAESRIGWMDFALSAIASGLAAFSAGMGLGLPQVGYFFVMWILLGTLVSSIVQRFVPEAIARLDGVVYTVGAIAAIAYALPLNRLLSDGGFPRQLILAGVLCWMLVIGSISLWRDLSLLFQAVPCIALFGLVGTWDTFQGSTYAFFGFLLCFAAMFARAHRRQMLGLALMSGYPRLEEIRSGPWRWMAGPEWALGSASAVLFLSFLGAPLLQQSVSGFAGRVRVPTPATNRTTTTNTDPFRTSDAMQFSAVGQGPADLSSAILFRATLPGPGYLRSRTYGRYDERGWVLNPDFADRGEMMDTINNPVSGFNIFRNAVKNPVIEPFSIEPVVPISETLPIPGELEELESSVAYGLRPDGTVALQSRATGGTLIKGTARMLPEGPDPVRAGSGLPEVYTDPFRADRTRQRVRDLATEVTQGIESDFEKAKALQSAIERIARYNINAAATPTGQEAVEHFLFESKEGYCDLFASAMVQLARSVGLPARYVTGYYAKPASIDRDGRFTVREADAHAWAEVFFEEHGWIPFDPTSGAQEVPGGGVGTPTTSEPWLQRTWVQVSLGIVGLGVVGGLGTLLFHWARRRLKTTRSPRTRLASAYYEMVRGLEKVTGKPRRPSYTPYEYWDVISEHLPPSPELDALHEAFVASFYGPVTTSNEEIDGLRVKSKQALRSLRASMSAKKG